MRRDASARAVLSALAALLQHCPPRADLWGRASLALRGLLSFSIDTRHKVRRCAQRGVRALLRRHGSADGVRSVGELTAGFLLEVLRHATPANTATAVQALPFARVAAPLLRAGDVEPLCESLVRLSASSHRMTALVGAPRCLHARLPRSPLCARSCACAL